MKIESRLLPLALLCACSTTDDRDADPAPAPRLLANADRLHGRRVIERSEGAWRMRRVEAPPAALTEIEARSSLTAESFVPPAGSGAATDPRAAEMLALLRDTSTALPEATRARGEFFAGHVVATPSTPVLRAGTTDDNADHAAFVAWLGQQTAQLGGRCQPLDVAARRTVRVVDRDGRSLPGTTVALIDEDGDRVVWRGTTLGDGRFPLWPGVIDAAPATYLVEARDGASVVRRHWDGKGDELVVAMPGAGARGEVLLDVVFLIDTTGSMNDEIDRIKATLLGVTTKLEGLDREFDLRYGAVLYRDVSDAYVTMAHALSDDLVAFDRALQAIDANGGGDTPESLNQGLAVAVDGMEWRPDAAKLVFLIADAPPHMDYQDDIPYGESLVAAVGRGIRVHAVAASGLDEAGTVVLRQIAHFTRGEFVFIEYGGDVAASGRAHGVSGPVTGNNLDDILFERIRNEIAGWGQG